MKEEAQMEGCGSGVGGGMLGARAWERSCINNTPALRIPGP